MIEFKENKLINWTNIKETKIFVKLASVFKTRKEPMSLEEICLDMQTENSNDIK
jgi:hypothetical protein